LAEGVSVETVGIAIPGKELQGQPFILWVFVVFFFFLMVLWLERRDSNQARQVLDCLKHASRTFSLVSLEIGSNFCLEL
jgi:hypothetical protein